MRVMRNLVLHLQGHTQSAVEELSVLSGHGASSSAQLPFTVLKVHLGKRPTPLENWTVDTTQDANTYERSNRAPFYVDHS